MATDNRYILGLYHFMEYDATKGEKVELYLTVEKINGKEVFIFDTKNDWTDTLERYQKATGLTPNDFMNTICLANKDYDRRKPGIPKQRDGKNRFLWAGLNFEQMKDILTYAYGVDAKFLPQQSFTNEIIQKQKQKQPAPLPRRRRKHTSMPKRKLRDLKDMIKSKLKVKGVVIGALALTTAAALFANKNSILNLVSKTGNVKTEQNKEPNNNLPTAEELADESLKSSPDSELVGMQEDKEKQALATKAFKTASEEKRASFDELIEATQNKVKKTTMKKLSTFMHYFNGDFARNHKDAGKDTKLGLDAVSEMTPLLITYNKLTDDEMSIIFDDYTFRSDIVSGYHTAYDQLVQAAVVQKESMKLDILFSDEKVQDFYQDFEEKVLFFNNASKEDQARLAQEGYLPMLVKEIVNPDLLVPGAKPEELGLKGYYNAVMPMIEALQMKSQLYGAGLTEEQFNVLKEASNQMAEKEIERVVARTDEIKEQRTEEIVDPHYETFQNRIKNDLINKNEYLLMKRDITGLAIYKEAMTPYQKEEEKVVQAVVEEHVVAKKEEAATPTPEVVSEVKEEPVYTNTEKEAPSVTAAVEEVEASFDTAETNDIDEETERLQAIEDAKAEEIDAIIARNKAELEEVLGVSNEPGVTDYTTEKDATYNVPLEDPNEAPYEEKSDQASTIEEGEIPFSNIATEETISMDAGASQEVETTQETTDNYDVEEGLGLIEDNSSSTAEIVEEIPTEQSKEVTNMIDAKADDMISALERGEEIVFDSTTGTISYETATPKVESAKQK